MRRRRRLPWGDPLRFDRNRDVARRVGPLTVSIWGDAVHEDDLELEEAAAEAVKLLVGGMRGNPRPHSPDAIECARAILQARVERGKGSA